MAQHFLVRPVGEIGGTVHVPGDKSISHRALLLAALAEGDSEIEGLLEGSDCLAMASALAAMGVSLSRTGAGRYRIRGEGLQSFSSPRGAVDLGNSGTAIRLLTGAIAGQPVDAVLTGDVSLRRRPMERVTKPLIDMGATISSVAGCAPLTVRGRPRLSGLVYDMPIASAQVKSALLLAGLNAREPVVIRGGEGTRDHTERMLAAMGARIQSGVEGVRLDPGRSLEPQRFQVPGDFSSAAFLLVAGALRARKGMTLRDVGLNPTRIGLLAILDLMGADIRLANRRLIGGEPVADIEVTQSELRGIDIPPSLVPLAIDEFPIVFIAAAAAEGVTRLTGAEELRHKESDRIGTMVAGLKRVGIEASEAADGAVIRGGTITAGRVDSHGDHRVAMAFSVAALAASGEIRIDDVANVATSFPGFDAVVREVGFDLERKESG